MTGLGHPAPYPEDVAAVRGLLDLMADFSSNDQRARFLLSSNWLRDRGAIAAERVRQAEQQAILPTGSDGGAR
jgi:hypothetical protein